MSPRRATLLFGVLGLLLLIALFAWPRPAETPTAVPTPTAASEPEAPPAAEPPALGGRVVAAHDHQPIAGALVTATCADQPAVQRLTDRKGQFAFEQLAEGRCQVEVHAEGYLASVTEPAWRRELVLVEAEPFESLEVPLHAAVRLEGRVLRDGEGVPSARLSAVYVEAAEGLDSPVVLSDLARTDDDGAFALAGLSPGRIQLLVEHDTLGYAESAELTTHPGELRRDLRIELSPRAVLSGVVHTLDGRVLPGARVTARAEGGAEHAATAGADGRFTLDLPAGRLTLSASARGFGLQKALALELQPDDVREQELVLAALAGLGGWVEAADRSVLPGAAVDLISRGAVLDSVQTDGDGSFWFPVPGGDYTVSAHHPLQGRSADTPARFGDTDLRLRLGGTGRVSGTLTDANGRPVTQYRVDLVWTPIRGPGAAQEGLAGLMRRPSLPSVEVQHALGQLSLSYVEPGRFTALLAPTDGRGVLESDPFDVRAGQTTHLGTLRLRPSGAVVGRVVADGPDHAPLAGVRVSLEGPAGVGRLRAEVTPPDGSFHLQGVPAGGTLHFMRPGFRARLVSGLAPQEGGQLDLGDVALSAVQGKADAIQYTGVGLRLAVVNGAVVVQAAFDDSPAARAGLTPGTQLQRVNGLDVGRLSLTRVVELIRGEVGSELTLEVVGPDGVARRVRLVRAEVIGG